MDVLKMVFVSAELGYFAVSLAPKSVIWIYCFALMFEFRLMSGKISRYKKKTRKKYSNFVDENEICWSTHSHILFALADSCVRCNLLAFFCDSYQLEMATLQTVCDNVERKIAVSQGKVKDPKRWRDLTAYWILGRCDASRCCLAKWVEVKFGFRLILVRFV